ncbi:Acg family FMN-binding oxidoreductase [Frankia sp. AgKG'84/4]
MTTAEVRRVVAAAARAPSVHNTQPWLFDWDGRHLDLHADWSRQVPVLDPAGRQLTMSCGAALALAIVGLGAHGRDPRLSLPGDGRGSGPLARLDTLPPLAAGEVERARELFGAIGPRRMVRGRFAGRRVPAALRGSLVGAAAGQGAVATPLLSPDRLTAVADLIAAADTAQRSSPRLRVEQAHWLRGPTDARDDGVTPAPAEGAAGRGLPNRYDHASAGRLVPGPRPVSVDTAGRTRPDRVPMPAGPDLLLLSTAGDEPADWLMAGRALATVLLVATRLGLGVMLVNQPIDAEDTRRDLGRATGIAGHPQALLAVGYALERPAPQTSRRAVDTYFTNRRGPLPADERRGTTA